jgi:hypothetical protein
MLLFVTTRGHEYTVKSLTENRFGSRIPECRVTSYDVLFGASETLRSTHIFTDIERLYPWELRLASDLYRGLREAGLVCLNDPARVMCRYELLHSLYAAGFNPFTAYRADDAPRPKRFPVFIRHEAEHRDLLSGLIPDQAALVAELARLRDNSIPPRGLLVVEFAGEEIAPGVWRRFGTFRVGEAMSVDHATHDSVWAVKRGKVGVATEQMYEFEQTAVTTNAFVDEIRPAFTIAGIEYGRADHGTFQGRQVVYEINTNPTLGALHPHPSATRMQSHQFAHDRFAQQLWQIDSGDGSTVSIPLSVERKKYRRREFAPAARRP